MQHPDLPPNEDERLFHLRRLLILDTVPEDRYDRLTSFAAAEFDVPIALLSLVDRHRQWFKSRVGLDVCETGRDISLCGHAILQDAPMVVPDTSLDERFWDNPLVVGSPHIRFYAGAPLRLSSGHSIGTFCLIDTKPRVLDAVDLHILSCLRDLAVEELTLQASQETGE